uniref:Nucleoside-diphosphate-sugar epimerase n=1 Tax=Cordyceps militaris TaxID=73501 RepID=J3SFQ9_CORMI|nr:nucleoside-diphosphate-sugar epimerase [Cordyceps militaris]
MTSSSSNALVALVFGASGVSGWGLAHELANWSQPTPFSRIMLLTCQPITTEELRLADDDRVSIHSGIDLSQSEEQVSQALKQLPAISTVTHTARMNVAMTKTTVAALAAAAPSIKHLSFQSGSIVSIHRASTTRRETYPRISAPFGTMISAYGQEDAVPFPGNTKSWQSKFTVVGQKHLAHFNIASALQASSLTPSQLNISDGGEPSSWQELWPKITGYFGLVGSPPGSGSPVKFGPKWFEGVKSKAAQFEQEARLKAGFLTDLPWQYLEFFLGLKVDRVLNIERAKKTGLVEVSDTLTAFSDTWDMMKAARIIPEE